MDLQLLSALNEERRARRAAVVITDLAGGSQRFVPEAEFADDPEADAIAGAIRSGRCIRVSVEGRDLFLNVHLPPPRLVVIGAVHIAQALAPMAAIAGLRTNIIDPRTAFATAERFPNTTVRAEWPDLALRAHPLDAYTAVAAVTHDEKIDEFPLIEALRAKCFYVGALGSRKTHARRVERLRQAGVPDGDIARIESPIGLDIGAATPEEIAVAILASVVAALRRRAVEPAQPVRTA